MLIMKDSVSKSSARWFPNARSLYPHRSEAWYLKKKKTNTQTKPKKPLVKLLCVCKFSSNLEMAVVKIVVRIASCCGVLTPWMMQSWYWEFKRQPQNWATGWECDAYKLPLAAEMNERQFLFFLFLFSPWSGKPLGLTSFHVLLPKVATGSVCSFCSPSLGYRCGGRHPRSFPFFPQHVPACLSPLSCCVVRQSSVVWAGL